MLKIIRLIIFLVVLGFALNLEYDGRPLYMYIKEVPYSIYFQRIKYYVVSTITGKRDPKKEKQLFDNNNSKMIDAFTKKDKEKLKSIIIEHN